MMQRNRIQLVAGCLALACSLAIARPARGAGFLVYDVSAEALGKGSAHAAAVNEPAAVFFNPAALAFMHGYQAQAGAVYVTAGADFTPQDGGEKVDAMRKHFFLPTIYASARITDWMSVGLGLYTIFGLGIEWPHDWLGRESSIEASIETVTISPTVAFKLHRTVSVGVGVNVVRGVVDMTNGLPEAVGGTVRIGGATWGAGAHAAVMWRILPDKLHFATVYHSRAKLSFDGRADFEPEHEEFEPQLPDQGGAAEITLPDILTFAFMYRPLPQLTITFDTNVVFWSTYDELVLDFENPDMTDEVLPRNNRNVATFRLGFDYEIIRGLHARLGFIYDMNPAPKKYISPSLPDANRFDVGVGIGYEWKWLKVDVGYLLVYFMPSKSEGGLVGPEGEYNSLAHLTALTVAARFGHEGPPSPEAVPIPPEEMRHPGEEHPAPPAGAVVPEQPVERAAPAPAAPPPGEAPPPARPDTEDGSSAPAPGADSPASPGAPGPGPDSGSDSGENP